MYSPSSTPLCLILSFSNIPAQLTLRPTTKNTANKFSHRIFLLKNNTVHGLWLSVYLLTKMQIHSFCLYGLTTTGKFINIKTTTLAVICPDHKHSGNLAEVNKPRTSDN